MIPLSPESLWLFAGLCVACFTSQMHVVAGL
jgi:hypothetical protein